MTDRIFTMKHTLYVGIASSDTHQEIDVKIEYRYSPSCPARIRYDENNHPAEPASVEIMKVYEREDPIIAKSKETWIDASDALYEMVDHEFDCGDLEEKLFRHAREQLEIEDGAREAAAEDRWDGMHEKQGAMA